MMINQNLLAVLITFSNLHQGDNFQTGFVSKIHNRKKISNRQFDLCEAKISLDEIIKSINSQTNGSYF